MTAEDGDDLDEAARLLACEIELMADQAELVMRREEWRRTVRAVARGIAEMDAPTARRTFDTTAAVARGLRVAGDPDVAARFEEFAQFVAAAQFEEHGTRRLAELGLTLHETP